MPPIGAAFDAFGVHTSGMCPSPANSPEVGSIPIQPAPGQEGFSPGVQIGGVGLDSAIRSIARSVSSDTS